MLKRVVAWRMTSHGKPYMVRWYGAKNETRGDNIMNLLHSFSVLGLAAALALPGAAIAQNYKWRDEKGAIVYSDQPPPSNIPRSSILTAPKTAKPAPVADPAAAGGKDGKNGKDGKPTPAAAKSIAEKEADYKKRQIEEQKKAKDEAEKSAQAERNRANCDSLKRTLASLEGGQRISRTDSKGERYFVGDEERARDIAKARDDLSAGKCN